MKKYIFLALAFFGLYANSAFASPILFNIGTNVYIKPDETSTDNKVLFASGAYIGAFSHDGVGVYIQKASDQTMYYKLISNTNVNDFGTYKGAGVSSRILRFLSESADGSKLIAGDGNYIWQKNATDSSDFSLINTGADSSYSVGASFFTGSTSINYSNRYYGQSRIKNLSDSTATSGSNSGFPGTYGIGQRVGNDYYYLYSTNATNQPLYKKSAFDNSVGVQITTSVLDNSRRSFDIYTDGSKALYVNNNSYLYTIPTNAGSAGTGSQITSFAVTNPMYSYVPPESCSDGIQNQDETAIDYGGVCGIPAIQENIDGLTCLTELIPDLASTSWNNFGSISGATTYTGADVIGQIQKNISIGAQDVMIGVGFSTGSIIPPESITYPATGTASLFWPDTATIDNVPFISANSYRNGALYQWNVLEFFGVQSLGASNRWGTIAFSDTSGSHGHYGIFASGGLAIKVIPNGYTSDFFQIQGPASGFSGFRMGKAPLISKTSCDSPNGNKCVFQYTGGSLNCAGVLNESEFITGQCGIATSGTLSGACVPLADSDGTILPPLPLPGQTEVLDGSGNVIATGYNANPQDADIFTCTYTGLDTLLCPFQISSKIWAKFTSFIQSMGDLIKGIGSLGSKPGTGTIMGFSIFDTAYAEDLGKNLPAYWLTDGSGNVLPNQSEAYTGADIGEMNKYMFKAGDNAKNMDRGGIKGVWAFSYWYLFLVVLLFVISIISASFSKNDRY